MLDKITKLSYNVVIAINSIIKYYNRRLILHEGKLLSSSSITLITKDWLVGI